MTGRSDSMPTTDETAAINKPEAASTSEAGSVEQAAVKGTQESSETAVGLDVNGNGQLPGSRASAFQPSPHQPTTIASSETREQSRNINGKFISTGAEKIKSNEDVLSDKLPPADRFHLVYAFMFLLGVSCLLPWNFFVTASQYFQLKLRNVSLPLNLSMQADYMTSLQVNFASSLEVACIVPSLIFEVFVLLLMKRVSLKARLVSSLTVSAAIFCVTAALVKVDTDQWQNKFYIFTLATVVAFSGASAVAQSSLLGLAATLPPKYTSAVMSGIGFAGVLSALANIVTLVAGTDIIDSAFWYFIFADIILAISLGGAIFLQKLEYLIYYRRQSKIRRSDEGPAGQESCDKPSRADKLRGYVNIFRKIGVFACSIALVFAVTLAVYPGVAVNVHSVSEHTESWWSKKYFLPLYCFLMFNTGDLVGRLVAQRLRLPKPKLTILLLTVCRVAFIPLFMMCNVQPRQGPLPVLLEHDAYPYTFMALLSLSNGYLSTTAMMVSPSYVLKRDAEAAGVITAMSMMVGLCAGSLTSLPIIHSI